MKKRRGFTLMEIVVAMLLATMISTTVVTLIASSFKVVSENETFRNEKIFVDKAYELLRDEIANASKLELSSGDLSGVIISSTDTTKKAYKIKMDGRIYVKDSKGERLLYPIAIYRSEENMFKLTAQVDQTNKAVLKLGLKYYGNKDTTKEENYKYGLSSSVRVNLLSKKGGEITTPNTAEFTNPTIIITK